MTQPNPRKTVLERLFSLEGLLLLAGLLLFVFGLATGTLIAFFWGVLALAGQVALHFVRKKDWQAHWAELEQKQRHHRQNHPPDNSP